MIRDAALAYAERGVPVFPVHGAEGGRCACGKVDCGNSAGKHPLTANGFKDACLDREAVETWWRRWPTANIATPTGGWCVVLDVDPRHGGDDTLADLERRHGALPDTAEVLTGGGGRHIYFQPVPGLTNSTGKVGPGLDVRASGGYVLLPPSKHVSGREYADDVLAPLGETPLAPMPAWLLALACNGTGNGNNHHGDWIPVEKPPFAAPPRIKDGERNSTLYALARSLKARGLARDAVAAAVTAENAAKCELPLGQRELDALLRNAWEQADRADFAASAPRAEPAEAPVDDATPFSEPLGAFLARSFPPSDPYIDGLLSDEGGGWLGGEEKLGKTFWSLDEALALALGEPVAGLFTVPKRRLVLFVEEEDPPRRTHRRLRALLRGRGHDPDDPAVQADLDAWFRLSVWQGFTFDAEAMVARLAHDLETYHPAVCYVDVLRKVTLRDLNKAAEAGALLATLDKLRRAHNVVFRILHHYRKVQGHRAGRGSQEIGGSFALGAWGENSIFFEPVGRKQGAVRVAVQSKDSPPVAAFLMRLESEGPRYGPTLVRVVAEEEKPDAAASAGDEQVCQAIGSLPVAIPMEGDAGVSVAALALHLSRSKDSVQRAIDRLLDAGRIRRAGLARRNAVLYGVKINGNQ